MMEFIFNMLLNHDSSQFNLGKSPVAKPGFRRRGNNLWVCGKNLLFGKKFVKN